MGFLEKLAQILGRKPTPAVGKCPLEKGIICVAVSRQDKTNAGIPGIKVSLSGPTPGSQVTDSTGIAEFQDRTPGAYEFGVLFPSPKYKDWKIVPYGIDASVAGGQVTIAEVQAYPLGTLVVEVRRDDTGSLIANPADLWAVGAASLGFRPTGGTHTFKEVACGEYTVAAKVSGDLYEISSVSSDKVTVPEGGSVTAVLKVTPLTWIRVRVHDKDAKKDVPQIRIHLKPTGSATLDDVTDASGVHQFRVSKKIASCEIEQLISPDDVLYEVVDVVSA